MGKAKLNVWIRDENCRVVVNKTQSPQWDWVEVKNCMQTLVKHVDLQVGEAHVEIEVPPGCYVVQGHICMFPEVNFNNYTDKAMVVAGCNQELCVDLIIPLVGTCVLRDLHPFIREALQARVPNPDIVTTARTILVAGRIQPRHAIEEVRRIIKESEAKKAERAVREFTGTLGILEKLT
jgi:hypothetical protein